MKPCFHNESCVKTPTDVKWSHKHLTFQQGATVLVGLLPSATFWKAHIPQGSCVSPEATSSLREGRGQERGCIFSPLLQWSRINRQFSRCEKGLKLVCASPCLQSSFFQRLKKAVCWEAWRGRSLFLFLFINLLHTQALPSSHACWLSQMCPASPSPGTKSIVQNEDGNRTEDSKRRGRGAGGSLVLLFLSCRGRGRNKQTKPWMHTADRSRTHLGCLWKSNVLLQK